MKSEETIISEWRELESVDKILSAIRQYEIDMRDYLAETVASLCNVDKSAMLGESDKTYLSQARWLFWYSYRYMTGETFEKISILTADDESGARKFTTTAIGAGCNKMSALIATDSLWRKRWEVVKKIIKLRENPLAPKEDNTIVINVPKDLRDKIKIAIKEK